MASQANSPLTEDEYLRLERAAGSKSEFHDGQMFAMSGGTLNHAFLGSRIGYLLTSQLPRGCRMFSSDLRVKVAAANVYTYPDCQVICGEPAIADEDNALNPVLLVEVLSPSTEAYDRGKKFELYRTIPSFVEYLLIHQDRRHVEHDSRQDDDSWILREYSGKEASVEIVRWGARIVLADLYEGAFNLGD